MEGIVKWGLKIYRGVTDWFVDYVIYY